MHPGRVTARRIGVTPQPGPRLDQGVCGLHTLVERFMHDPLASVSLSLAVRCDIIKCDNTVGKNQIS